MTVDKISIKWKEKLLIIIKESPLFYISTVYYNQCLVCSNALHLIENRDAITQKSILTIVLLAFLYTWF